MEKIANDVTKPAGAESEFNAGLERKLAMAENKAELLAEDIEVLHMNLDHIGIPRDDGHGNIYSMWGRVQKALVRSNAELCGAKRPIRTTCYVSFAKESKDCTWVEKTV